MHFEAALFDMDGTILDSMDVWAQVDADFFARRGMVSPPDYGPALAGKSFYQSAVYTKERFGMPESPEEIVAEWNELCRLQYEQHVALKPGAAKYLRMLKRHGVKIAAATALPEFLFLPALKRNGVADLFDAFASTEETGTHKSTGDIYRLAAKKLGADPMYCIVFEDILEGHVGAKAAGMRSCNVYDRHADHNRAEITALATYCTVDFTQGAPLPDYYMPWVRAVIVTSYPEYPPLDAVSPADCVIAVDRGYYHCKAAGLTPDYVLGDFDSLLPGEAPPAESIRHPAEKDDTDAALALKLALKLGFTQVALLGGVGGRLDHTLANLQLMRYAASRGASLSIDTGSDRAQLLHPGVHALPPFPVAQRFSLFAFSPAVSGLRIAGAKYSVEDCVLTDSFPLGVSNETLPNVPAQIEFSDGLLLMVFSRDPQ